MLKSIFTDSMVVGHSSSEVYFKFGDIIIIVPPGEAKRFLKQLQSLNGLTDPQAKPKKKSSWNPKEVLTSLYKTHRYSKSVVTVNTNRKKKLPDRD